MSEQDARVQELWTYAGIRLSQSHKKLHAWQDREGGELLYFGKLTGHAIGGQYEVMVNRAPEGEFQTVSLAPKFAGSQCDDRALVGQWQTEHRLAEVKLARERAERKIRSEPDSFNLAIEPLRALRAKSCRTWADRVAFLAMVVEHLGAVTQSACMSARIAQ